MVYTRDGSNCYRPHEQHFAAFEEDCEYAKVEWLYPDILKWMSKNYIFKETVEAGMEKRMGLVKEGLERWNSEWLQNYPEQGPFTFPAESKVPQD